MAGALGVCEHISKGRAAMTTHSVPVPTKHFSEISKGLNIALWILQILAAAMFLFAGSLKLTGAAQMVAMFDKIGIGQWFRYFTGALEVTSGVLLLIPRTAAIGAALLAATMIG